MSQREKGFGAESLNLTWRFASLLHVWTCQLNSNKDSVGEPTQPKTFTWSNTSTLYSYFDLFIKANRLALQICHQIGVSITSISYDFASYLQHLSIIISLALIQQHYNFSSSYSPSLFTIGYLLIQNINKYSLRSSKFFQVVSKVLTF